MRSITVSMAREGGFHPTAYQRLADESDHTREAILHFNVLDDGTVVGLTRFRGDPDRARELIGRRSDVIDYSVSGGAEGTGIAYVHSRPPDPLREILQLSQAYEVFFDFPLERVREHELRATIVGDSNEVLQRALEAVPEEVDVTVERIGEYRPDNSDVSALLTDRQQEILEVAVEMGYYENPRGATHGEVAERVGLDHSTVSEHLRKIEARVFGSLVG